MSAPDPSATTAGFYDAIADEYAMRLPDTSFEAPLDLGMLDHFVTTLPGDARVLDAGCGTGRMLTYLEDRGIRRLSGLDASARMIEIARSRRSAAELTTGDLLDPPYPDGTFDGVLAWYSIIHTRPADYPELVRSFDRVLAGNGLLLLAFQTGTGSRIVGRSYAADVALVAHRHGVDELSGALVSAGFDIVARAERGARTTERDAQGFILARASPPRPSEEHGGR